MVLTDVTSLVVESTRVGRGSKDGDTSLALDEVTPLRLRRVPLQPAS